MIKPSDFLGDRYILEKAVETYGTESQVDMAIEEMSELTKALLKYRRASKNQTDIGIGKAHADILEEMADVEIMLDQMKIIYGEPICERKHKIDRLKERLDGENNDKC